MTIKILSLDQWQTRFNRIIEKIHKRSNQYTPDTPEEIETDISQAIKEVREEKRDNQGSY